MSEFTIRICPPARYREALELALGVVEHDQRGAVVDGLRPLAEAGIDVFAGLVIAERRDQIVGAAWVQPQVGRTATLWPPTVAKGVPAAQIIPRLLSTAVRAAEILPVDLVQALLDCPDDPLTGPLSGAGFTHLADLKYLLLTVPRHTESPIDRDLRLESPAIANRPLLERLIVETYQLTLDCPGLESRRDIADVIAGYQTVGEHDSSLWFVAHYQDTPAGVMLLAPYPEADQWELIYMGVVPKLRGRGIGARLLAELRYRASQAGVGQVVLAVDSRNRPAVNMYEEAGFVEWTRRTAYILSLVGPASG